MKSEAKAKAEARARARAEAKARAGAGAGGGIGAEAKARAGAFEGFGNLVMQTGNRFRSQWCPQYFSEVLPFVIPRMVSGPDFREEAGWR